MPGTRSSFLSSSTPSPMIAAGSAVNHDINWRRKEVAAHLECSCPASYPAEMIALLSTSQLDGKREILPGRNTTLDSLKDHVIHQSVLPHIPVRITPRMKTATNLGYMIRFYCPFLDCMGPPGLSPQLTLLRRSTSGGFRVHC